MKKLMFAALVAEVAGLTGCQTQIKIESDETHPLPIQQQVNDHGTNRVINTGYFEPRPHYYIMARSPLFAKESVAKFAAKVEDGGKWSIDADGYSRDLSTNATAMVDGMFKNGANLALAIGDAYCKIAGGGAQAATVMDVAAKCVNFFQSKGGDLSKATVVADEAAKKLTISDGTTCVECNEAGVCTDCQIPAAS